MANKIFKPTKADIENLQQKSASKQDQSYINSITKGSPDKVLRQVNQKIDDYQE
jgi:hypothetical protein